jgi:hypothetical protein
MDSVVEVLDLIVRKWVIVETQTRTQQQKAVAGEWPDISIYLNLMFLGYNVSVVLYLL